MISNRKEYDEFYKCAKYDRDGMIIGVKKDAPAGAKKGYDLFRKAQAEQEERMYKRELRELKNPVRKGTGRKGK